MSPSFICRRCKTLLPDKNFDQPETGRSPIVCKDCKKNNMEERQKEYMKKYYNTTLKQKRAIEKFNLDI